MYTRADWSDAFLTAIGNQHHSDYVRQWVESWTQWETAHPPGAAYNLLNTTEPWKPDGTAYAVTFFNDLGNGQHVMNYASFADGIEANAKVLRNGKYPALLHALVNNDEAALKSPTTSAIAAEIDLWGTHHAVEIAALASDLANLRFAEPFPGDATPVSAPPPQPTPAPQGGAVTLKNFPMISERTQITGDGHPSENAGLNCVNTSILAGVMWLKGISQLGGIYTPDSFKDAVYGQGTTGGESASAYVPYLETLGINLLSQSGSNSQLVAAVHSQIQAGHPVVFTEPNPYGNPNFTHVCVFFGEQPGFLTALDPWIAQAVTHSDFTWINTLLNNEIWILEKITLMLPDALARAGWKDVDGVLYSPDHGRNIPISGTIREYILTRNPAWHPDDYAVTALTTLPNLEGSNIAIGAGQVMLFRFSGLEMKAGTTRVFEMSVGSELAWTRGKIAEFKAANELAVSQIQQDQVTIAAQQQHIDALTQQVTSLMPQGAKG